MVISVRTERGPAGLEVVKEAETDADRARLRHEAEMLARAAQPGVVEVTATSDATLRLRHRGTALSRLGALPPDHVAAVVRSVAEVVESLHRQGIAHTRIDMDHVVIGDRGRPRLCGFGAATEADEDLRAADVAGLGKLLDELLDPSGDSLWSPVHRGPRHARRRRKALAGFRAAAQAARREDPGQRPSARQFANALHDALPELALPIIPSSGTTGQFAAIPADIDPTADLIWTNDDLSFLTADDDDLEDGDPFVKLAALSEPPAPPPEPVPDPPQSPLPPENPTPPENPASESGPAPGNAASGSLPPVRIRPASVETRTEPATSRRTLIAIAVVVLVLGAIAGAVIARSVNPFGSDQASAADTTEPSPTSTVPASTPTPPPFPSGCNVPTLPGPDTDGDGCPEPVDLDGRVATVGNVEVELGQDRDEAVLADHDCDGVVTPVLLRPATGEVFVFPTWSLDEPLEIHPVAVVPDAQALQAADDLCGPVTVTDRSDSRQIVAGPGA